MLEWIALIEVARDMDISPAEVRDFIERKKHENEQKEAM